MGPGRVIQTTQFCAFRYPITRTRTICEYEWLQTKDNTKIQEPVIRAQQHVSKIVDKSYTAWTDKKSPKHWT